MSASSDPGSRLRSGPTLDADLHTALSQGDPQRVRALIEAGADVCYKRDHGYDALLDAVHGVRLLLEAGADYSQLEWTPFIEAVACGSLADVQTALAHDTALEE